jgi:hypothetical protein
VRSEQHGCRVTDTIALQVRAHPVSGVGIERCGRLVEQQHLRPVEQGLGERHTRLLAGRQLAGRAVEEFNKIEVASKLQDARVDVGCAIELREYGQVLPHREARRHVHVRAFEIHPVQHAVALARHLGAQYRDGAGGRRHQPHDGRNGGRLAGAVAAKQAGNRTHAQAKGNAVNGGRALVALHQAVDGDGGRVPGVHGRHDVTRSYRKRKGRFLSPVMRGLDPHIHLS